MSTFRSSVPNDSQSAGPTLRQLHNLTIYSPIESIPLPPTTPPAPVRTPVRAPVRAPIPAPVPVRRPVAPPPPPAQKVAVNRNVSSNSNTSVRFPIGSRIGKPRKMVEEADFLRCGENGLFGEAQQRKRLIPKMKDAINMMLDYMELNLLAHKKLPPFPKEFHKIIADFAYEIFMRHRVHTDNTKVYTVIHECVKQLPNCQDVPFAHFSIFPVDVLYDDKKFEEALKCTNLFLS